ncbi:hypothetical protein lerEdw1_019364 [Lerista edwardsae]|nr:hypothetical protein lerEdw1_019364 [Lerista edwardsae]
MLRSLSLCFCRYFLCEIISEEPSCQQLIDERTVHSAVKNAIARMHGDFGLACCSIAFAGWLLGSSSGDPAQAFSPHAASLLYPPPVKYLNAYTGVVLLCCRKDFARLLWSSLPFVTQLESRHLRCPCAFHTLHVGGEPVLGGGGCAFAFCDLLITTPGAGGGLSCSDLLGKLQLQQLTQPQGACWK